VSEPFVAEIRAFAFSFPPRGWAYCNGQILPISQNTALFSLLGTFYGGDGKSNFALPNLQGNAPLNFGQGAGLSDRLLGETGGEPTVTLIQSEIPGHTHAISGSTANGDATSPTNNTWAVSKLGRQSQNRYQTAPGAGAIMSGQALNVAGGSQPHNNMPPYLVMNFCIALQGIYPPRG